MLQDSLLQPRPAWLALALTALARHTFLTAPQLGALVDHAAGDVAGVLDALVGEGLLATLHPTPGVVPTDRSPAYALTREGARLVAPILDGHVPSVPPVRRSLFTLAHDLARNDLGVVLELLDRRAMLRLDLWQTTRAALGDVAWVQERGEAHRVPLVADALVRVTMNERTTSFLVETDRATLAVERMRRKFQAYLAWWENGGPARRFGTASLRLLVLAPDHARLRRLREAAIAATAGRGSGLFWFATQDVVALDDPCRLLGPVWSVARPDDTTCYELLAGARAFAPAPVSTPVPTPMLVPCPA